MILPPLDKGRPTPFATLMRLEKIGQGKFRSTMSAYEPGGNVARANGVEPRAYGGHVLAQAVYAASRTVTSQFVCHNMQGNFLRGGKADVPYIYVVETLYDGKTYCIRAVNATQEGGQGLNFRCTCSFKKIEDHPLDYQQPKDVQHEYRAVLEGKEPEDHPVPLSSEAQWFVRSKDSYNGPPFPGLRSRMVDIDAYNRNRAPHERRRLHLYTCAGDLPSVHEDPNLHIAAHLYASDRNSLYAILQILSVQDYYGFTTTMSQSAIFHSNVESLAMTTTDGEARWFIQEAWTDRFTDSRGVYHSKIFNGQSSHIATTMQEGIIRLDLNDKETKMVKDSFLKSSRF